MKSEKSVCVIWVIATSIIILVIGLLAGIIFGREHGFSKVAEIAILIWLLLGGADVIILSFMFNHRKE